MFGRILNGHEQFQEQMHGALDRRDDGLQWAQKVLNKKEQLRDAWDDVAKMVHRTKKSHNVWMFLLFYMLFWTLAGVALWFLVCLV